MTCTLILHKRCSRSYTPMVPLVSAYAKVLPFRGAMCEIVSVSDASPIIWSDLKTRMSKSSDPTTIYVISAFYNEIFPSNNNIYIAVRGGWFVPRFPHHRHSPEVQLLLHCLQWRSRKHPSLLRRNLEGSSCHPRLLTSLPIPVLLLTSSPSECSWPHQPPPWKKGPCCSPRRSQRHWSVCPQRGSSDQTSGTSAPQRCKWWVDWCSGMWCLLPQRPHFFQELTHGSFLASAAKSGNKKNTREIFMSLFSHYVV